MQHHENDTRPGESHDDQRETSADSPLLATWLAASDESLVVIIFSAKWMGSTFMFTDAVKDVVNTTDQVTLFEADVEENSDLALQLGVSQVPTTMLLRDHEVVDMMTGTISRNKFNARMRPFLSESSEAEGAE